MEKETIVYAVCDPNSNEIRYIGKTCRGLNERKSGHKGCKEKNHRANWFRKMYSEGIEPTYHVVETVSAGEDWQEAEVFWITYFRSLGANLLNATVGGEGAPGAKRTEEQLVKLRAAANLPHRTAQNKLNIMKAQESNIGRKHSAEWIENRASKVRGKSNSNLGRKQTPEQIENSHAPLRGVKKSIKAKISLSTGSKHRAAFSLEEIVEILEKHFIYGYPVGFLCKEFNISNLVVKRIVENKSYLWIEHPLRCPVTRELHIVSSGITEYHRTHYVTEETKVKISKANTGKKASAETIERLRASHVGKVANNKGIAMPEGQRLAMVALSPAQVEEVRSKYATKRYLQKELVLEYGVSINTINRVLKYHHPYTLQEDVCKNSLSTEDYQETPNLEET